MTRHSLDIAEVPLEAILAMREAYRLEMNCQVVHDSWHARGFTSSYLLRVDGDVVGYGSVGGAPREARDVVKELYVLPAHRGAALPLFRQLVATSGARFVEAQSNDVLLSLMLHDCAADLSSETILFDDRITTTLPPPVPEAVVRLLTDADRARVFEHTREPVGDWGVESDGQIVATGGLFFHYNPPYGDIYMEVAPTQRERGFGSWLVQEVKRACRDMGRVPAARCDQSNVASRRTLERAGMFPCARIVRGRLVR